MYMCLRLYVDMFRSHVNAYVYNVIYILLSEGYRASGEVVKNWTFLY